MLERLYPSTSPGMAWCSARRAEGSGWRDGLAVETTAPVTQSWIIRQR